MKFRLQWLLILVLSLICLAGWGANSQTRNSPGWEYKFIEAPPDRQAQGQLDTLGAQGWELVAVERTVFNGQSYSTAIYYLKRRK